MNDLPRPTAFAEPDPREVAALFDWLAAVFAAPPNRETVAAYRRGQAADWLNAVATIPGCAEGVARMRRALDADADDGRVAARIGAAYGMLFEGIGGPKTVSPYELVHRGGRLFGPPAAAMAAILAVHDLSVAASAGEPADHIAVELATASRLLAEARSGRSDDARSPARLDVRFRQRLHRRRPLRVLGGSGRDSHSHCRTCDASARRCRNVGRDRPLGEALHDYAIR